MKKETKKELIKKLKACRIVDTNPNIIIKSLDYSNNPLSPVSIAYRVFYTSLGRRVKCTYFGDGLGFQG